MPKDKPKDKPDRKPPKDKPPRRDRPSRDRGRTGNFRARASRDISAAYQPVLDELTRQEEAGTADAAAYQDQVRQLYEGLQAALGGISPQMDQQLAGVQQRFTEGIGGLTGLLGSATPVGEQQAATGLLGNQATGGLSMLASQGGRAAAFGASTQRQAAIDSTSFQGNILEQLQQMRDSINRERTDITNQQPAQILSRVDELRQLAEQMRLARNEFRLRRMLAQEQLGMEQGRYTTEQRAARQERRSDQALGEFTTAQLQNALQRARRGERRADRRGETSTSPQQR